MDSAETLSLLCSPDVVSYICTDNERSTIGGFTTKQRNSGFLDLWCVREISVIHVYGKSELFIFITSNYFTPLKLEIVFLACIKMYKST